MPQGVFQWIETAFICFKIEHLVCSYTFVSVFSFHKVQALILVITILASVAQHDCRSYDIVQFIIFKKHLY